MLQKVLKVLKNNKISILLVILLVVTISLILYIIGKNSKKDKKDKKDRTYKADKTNKYINKKIPFKNITEEEVSTEQEEEYIYVNNQAILDHVSNKLLVVDQALQQVQDTLDKKVNTIETGDTEFMNVSGLESLIGIPVKKKAEKFSDLKLNIDDNMSTEMKLQRMKFVLLELKKELEKNKNSNRLKEEFTNNDFANQILNDVGDLLKDISKNREVESEITQEEHGDITVEEEIIMRENNRNKDNSNENVYIHSLEQEGIDSIYHPRIHVI